MNTIILNQPYRIIWEEEGICGWTLGTRTEYFHESELKPDNQRVMKYMFRDDASEEEKDAARRGLPSHTH